MVDFFREVDDALQQEKLERFWHENATYILTLIFALIMGTAIWSGYNYWKVAQAEENTLRFMEIANTPLDKTNLLSVEELHETYPGLTANQKALAHFYAAQRALSLDEPKLAFTHMKAITDLPSSTHTDIKNVAAYYARNMILNGSITGDINDIKIVENSHWDPLFTIQDSIRQIHTDEEYAATINKLNTVLAEDSPAPAEIQEIAAQLKHVYSYEQKKSRTTQGDEKS